MVRLSDLLKEVEQEKLDGLQQKELDESLGKVIGTAALAAMSLFPAKIKAQQAKEKAPTTQTTKQVSDTIEVKMGSLFGSGKYKIHDKQLLDPVYAKIVNHLVKHPDANLEISIVASESKVPARDGEKAGNPKVDTGFLATRRAETAKEAIQELLDLAKEKGFFKGTATFNTPEIKTKQGPDWDPAKGADDSSYTAHQYVNANIKAVGAATPDTTTTDYQAGFYERTWVDGAPVAFTYATYKSGKGALNTGVEDVLIRFFDIDKISASKDKGLPAYGNAAKVLARDLYTTEAYLIPGGVFNKQAGKKSMGRDELSKFKIYKLKSVNASPDGNISVTYEKSTEERNAHTEDVLGK